MAIEHATAKSLKQGAASFQPEVKITSGHLASGFDVWRPLSTDCRIVVSSDRVELLHGRFPELRVIQRRSMLAALRLETGSQAASQTERPLPKEVLL